MAAVVKQVKVVLMGDESVGKTSILSSWINGTYSPDSTPTVGAATKVHREKINGEIYNFQVWDTAGAERYRALTPLYSREACAALLVFDLTNRKTFENLDKWIEFIHEQGNFPAVLVGNKEDLTSSMQVTTEEAQEYAAHHNSEFFNTSAKTGNNIDLAFRQLMIHAVEYMHVQRGESRQQQQPAKTVEAVHASSGGCC